MDFTFSSEQEDFRQAVRSTLAAEAPSAYVRQMIEDPVGVTPGLWGTMAELGWLGVLVPESAGGLGLGLVDLVVLQEELGKLPFPGPFVSSAVAATLAAVRLGVDELLGDLASGARRGTVAVEERGQGDPLAGVRATAKPDGDTAVLSGVKPAVLDGASADWALVVADDGDGLGTYLLESPGGEAVPGLDVTRKLARLALDGRNARRVGPPGDHTTIWRRILDDVDVALAAELVGTSERALELAVEYAKSGCSSTGPSPRSRPSSTRRPRCCTTWSSPGWARTTRRGRRTPTIPNANERRPCARVTPARRPWR